MLKKTIVALGCLIFLHAAAVNAAAGADKNVEVFLKNLEKTVSAWETYRYTKESEDWRGEEHTEKLTRFQFKKPNLMRTDVLSGEKKGSVVLLNKEGAIRGKNRMGLRKTMKPTDERLKNIRGYTFMNANLLDKAMRLKEHILEKGCQAALTEEEYMGRPAYRLHVDHRDAANAVMIDDAVTGEDVWFEKETYIILKNIKYEGEKKVTDGTWRDFEVNIPLDDDLFMQ